MKLSQISPLHSSEILIIFLKEPLEGRVKTRLGKTIGYKKACDIYKEFIQMIASRVTHSGWQICVFFDTQYPHEAPLFLQSKFPKSTLFIRQQEGDLGARLTYAFNWAFHQKITKKVAVIGGDSPDIPLDTLKNSFEKLNNYDITLGPTYDGGYYLLSMQQFFPSLFQGIHWSTENVFQETRDRAKTNSLSLYTHPKFRDVDTWDDFQLFKKENLHFPIS